MKKIVGITLATVMMATLFAGCSSTTQKDTATTTDTQTTETTTTDNTAMDKFISVISREDGSGTRGAFIEIVGVEEKNDAGEKVDNTTEEAIIANSTSIVMTTVAGDEAAIGYISLGSLNDTVKAVSVDGVEATAENVKSGSYTVSRPFNVVRSANENLAADDFMAFILSADGQAVVEANGYIAAVTGEAYTSNGATGKVVVEGSSSVTPVMEKLKEAYEAVNSNVSIEVQQSDSTTGMNAAMEGTCDIGMASRELKDSEVEAGLVGTAIAIDGIAVIVNNNNTVSDLTKANVKDIFVGNVENWNEVQ